MVRSRDVIHKAILCMSTAEVAEYCHGLEVELDDKFNTFEEWKDSIVDAKELADIIIITSLEAQLDAAERQLEKVHQLGDYCVVTESIHSEAINIDFVTEIRLKLESIMERKYG